MEKPGIKFERVWADEDQVELQISVSDGSSRFVNLVYVAHSTLDAAVSDLTRFKGHLHSGLLDLRFGEFGPEWANGAFHSRWSLLPPGRLFVTTRQETDFADFGQKNVASGATMHVASEPGLLDLFVAELESLARDVRQEAWLEGI